MSSLGSELQTTIRNLETLRDSQDPPRLDITTNLDKLYEQQIDLIGAAIRQDTQEYVNATKFMKEAAKKTKEAIDDLAKLDEGIAKVANAIGTTTELLESVG